MAEQRNNPLNPRVRGLMAGRPVHERFIIAGLSAIMGPEVLNVILNDVRPAAPDLSRVVQGQRLHWWVGKSREQIKRELPDDANVDEVIAALMEAGYEQVPEQPIVRDPAELADDRSRSALVLPRIPTAPPGPDAPRPQRAADSVEQPAPAPVTEPTFGDEQLAFSEVRGMSDSELRQIPGVSTNAIREIRRLELQYADREAAAMRNETAVKERNEALRLASQSETNPAAAGLATAPAGGAAPPLPLPNRVGGEMLTGPRTDLGINSPEPGGGNRPTQPPGENENSSGGGGQ